MAQMESALAAHDHIDLVYAHNDPMAMGAYLAAKAKGREGEMKFVGIDGLPGLDGGRQMVADGKLSATFVYPDRAAARPSTPPPDLRGREGPAQDRAADADDHEGERRARRREMTPARGRLDGSGRLL